MEASSPPDLGGSCAMATFSLCTNSGIVSDPALAVEGGFTELSGSVDCRGTETGTAEDPAIWEVGVVGS